MTGGLASWIAQLFDGRSGYVQEDWAAPEADAGRDRAEQVWAAPEPEPAPPVADAAASRPHLLGPPTGRTAATLAAMTGPGLCTPRR